ncbi:DoxX family protein [Natrinema longum]|uniref:DoxX family protein n=1 Tax=Natrinema longum TaxID=370324 RepID=A0A8A2UA34_9EURY|nr:DoxX family protein [Natrinema longum]MBZ6496617.1 DoxX family protein [Natrinema longum]QSW85484.1 DoxX family protein [Natrinema longum]
MRNPIQRETRTSERTPLRQSESNGGSVAESGPFRLARVLFGAVLAFMATDNFRNLEERIQYAESKHAPVPSLSVPAISGGLLFGSVGIVLWRMPVASAAAVAVFFGSVTPLLHDFWNVDDPEEKQQELIEFSKNAALLGAALAFLQLGRSQGPGE